LEANNTAHLREIGDLIWDFIFVNVKVINMFCPSCKKDLIKAVMAGVEIDYCPQCLGIWFDENELLWAKDRKDLDLRWLDIDLWQDKTRFEISKKTRQCPKCRLPMYEVAYGDSGIKVDLCNICHGIWLDKGEFRGIISYLKKKGKYEIMHEFGEVFLEEGWEVLGGPEGLKEEVLDFIVVLKLLQYKLLIQHPYISALMIALSNNLSVL